MNLLKAKAINLSFLALTHLHERKAERGKEGKKKKREECRRGLSSFP